MWSHRTKSCRTPCDRMGIWSMLPHMLNSKPPILFISYLYFIDVEQHYNNHISSWFLNYFPPIDVVPSHVIVTSIVGNITPAFPLWQEINSTLQIMVISSDMHCIDFQTEVKWRPQIEHPWVNHNYNIECVNWLCQKE